MLLLHFGVTDWLNNWLNKFNKRFYIPNRLKTTYHFNAHFSGQRAPESIILHPNFQHNFRRLYAQTPIAGRGDSLPAPSPSTAFSRARGRFVPPAPRSQTRKLEPPPKFFFWLRRCGRHSYNSMTAFLIDWLIECGGGWMDPLLQHVAFRHDC